jgi:hypothetical protein
VVRLVALLSVWIFTWTTTSALRAEVVVDFTSLGGWIYHGGQRVNDRTLNGLGELSSHYNRQPVRAPFRSPDGVGGRFTNHPEHLTNPTFFYGSLDGAGGFQFTPSGSFGSITRGSGTFSEYNDNFRAAAMSGILPVAIDLPNGVSLAAGTSILADFSGLRADLNNPSQWWYDQSTRTGQLTYTGGRWGFYYEGSPGDYISLATFNDVQISSTFDYSSGTNTLQWSATPELTEGLILPTSGGGVASILLPIGGVINEEMVNPTVGMFGRGSLTLPFRFDVQNASVPEPTSFCLLAAAVLCLQTRRARRMNV